VKKIHRAKEKARKALHLHKIYIYFCRSSQNLHEEIKEKGVDGSVQ
jgi:hypothetical protein